MEVKIERLSNSTKFFVREELNYDLIEHYSELLATGIKLPPITVLEDKQTDSYTILDGFHTYHAALKAGVEQIEVEITNKTSELDCFVEGVQKNSQHGQPLTTKDRRRNIVKILSFEDGWEWSNQIIAKIVGTSDRTVANVKKVTPSPKFSGMNEVKCFRNGKPHIVRVNGQSTINDTSEHSNSEEQQESVSSLQPSAFNSETGDTSQDQESQDVVLPDEQKVQLIGLMKTLQQKCLSYSRAYDAVNDGSKDITASFLERLDAQLTELKAQTESTTSLINELKEKVCAIS